MTETLQQLLSVHKKAGVLICGDRNQIEMSSLLSLDPSLKQIVNDPTRLSNILDVIVTNLSRYYKPPLIVPPISPDNPSKGVASDHNGVLAVPNTSSYDRQTFRKKIRKTIRPLPKSLLPTFGKKLCELRFDFPNDMNSFEMVI